MRTSNLSILDMRIASLLRIGRDVKGHDLGFSALFALLLFSPIAACSGLTHGMTLAERTQRMIPASVGPGASSLAVESAYDQTLRGYLQEHGTPDYIYVVDRYNVHLLYLNSDMVVTFIRSYTSNSTVAVRERIPDAMLVQVGEQDRGRVLVARGEQPVVAHKPKPPLQETTPDPVSDDKKPEGSLSVGTCFAVSPDGLIITAYHVVSKASAVVVYLADGTAAPAAIERASPTTDLALLRIKRHTPIFLSPAETGSLSAGQRVFTVGYPAMQILGADPKFSEGAINSLSGLGGDASFMQVSVPIQPGNSGGPLVTESGELAGVVLMTAKVSAFLAVTGTLPQNVNWAVQADYLLPLLGKRYMQPRALSRTAAIERTTKAVYIARVRDK